MENKVKFTVEVTIHEFIERMVLASRSIPIDKLVEMNKETIEQIPEVYTELSILLLKSSILDKEKLIKSIVANESPLLFKAVVEKNVNYVPIEGWEDAVVNSGRIDLMYIYAFNFYDKVNIPRIIEAFKNTKIKTVFDLKYARSFVSDILPVEERNIVLERIKKFEQK